MNPITRMIRLAVVDPVMFKQISQNLPAEIMALIEERAAEVRLLMGHPVPAQAGVLPHNAPTEAAFHSVHSSGKVCGHVHRNREKADACKGKLGEGWQVMNFENKYQEGLK